MHMGPVFCVRTLVGSPVASVSGDSPARDLALFAHPFVEGAASGRLQRSFIDDRQRCFAANSSRSYRRNNADSDVWSNDRRPPPSLDASRSNWWKLVARRILRTSALMLSQSRTAPAPGHEAYAPRRPARYPAFTVERDAAARHDHVHVRVMGHGRAPGILLPISAVDDAFNHHIRRSASHKRSSQHPQSTVARLALTPAAPPLIGESDGT
jgi:hypothetical protein